ncbi:MAG: hypothetical protein KatS3mg129_1912 [Leptospiraceae bacterium]|nr:MAG: hypothetical protein KatS3mg129_1912 [Leptospiraceae bacterium]
MYTGIVKVNTTNTDLKPETQEGLISDRSQLKPEDFEISELMALNTERGVVLNWKPVNITDIKYKIYRGKEPLDSLERLQKATFLGESIKPYFLDTDPIPDEPVYYGVSVYDIQTNKEYSDLKFRKSYISHTYKKPVIDYQYLEYLPDSLIAYQVNKNTIQLFWVDAGPNVKFYKVYRYDRPISNDRLLERAKYLGNAQSGSIGFIDKDLEPGRYFYAVFPVISSNQELKVFYANRTYTTFGIIIHGKPEKKKEEHRELQTESEGINTNIKNIIIRVENKNNVRITWDYNTENANKIKILIYRSPIQIRKYEDLKENSTYLGEFPLVAGVYVDRNLEKGSYYYNFIEYNTETNEITAFYYLKKPIEVLMDSQQSLNQEKKELLENKEKELEKKQEQEQKDFDQKQEEQEIVTS